MRSQTFVAAVIAVAVGLYVMVGRGAPVVGPVNAAGGVGAAAVSSTAISPVILVHVSGAVVTPGIVELSGSPRVADAVAAAGGASRHADLSAINLVAEIGDGDHLVVPAVGESPPSSESPDDAADGIVDLNTAGVGQLLELPGIGPVLAERIVRYRDDNGPFVVIEDLLDVAGIGEARLLELRALVDI